MQAGAESAASEASVKFEISKSRMVLAAVIRSWLGRILVLSLLLGGCPNLGTARTRKTAAAATAEVVKIANFGELAKCLAVVEGDEGAGSGFLLHYKGNALLFTNAHVVSGNPHIRAWLLGGKELNLDKFAVAKVFKHSVAQGFDVAVFSQNGCPDGMDYETNVEQAAQPGDDVIVLGNSEGQGVVTPIAGKLTGIGPDLIETDAKFVSGNSGSPIILVKTGKVIGIATFSRYTEYKTFGKDSKFNAVERRFGCRVDTIPGWEFPPIERFNAESETVKSMTSRTDNMAAMVTGIYTRGRLGLDPHLREDDPLAKSVHNYLSDLTAPRHSKEDSADIKDRFIRELLFENHADINSLNLSLFTEYHRRKLEEQMDTRELIRRALVQLQNIQD